MIGIGISSTFSNNIYSRLDDNNERAFLHSVLPILNYYSVLMLVLDRSLPYKTSL